MPIFLLLAETTWTWQFAAKQLEPWVHMVAVEEVLMERARSAFLVHWFGMRLPLKGLNVRVFIENLQELSDRYLVASKSAKGEVTGLNLTEPLAGIIGQAAGMLVSPTGLVLITAAVLRKSKTWLKVLVGVLLAITGAPFIVSSVVVGLVLGLGLPIGLLGGIAVGGTQEENTGAVIDLLGSLARLLNAARQFLEIIMGPVEDIRNPFLRQIIKLLGSLAALVPQILGFVAILVTRISPLLIPFIRELQAFQDLFGPVNKTLKFIKKDLEDRLKALKPVDTLIQIIGLVTDAAEAVIDIFWKAFQDFLSGAIDTFKDIFKHLKGESRDEKKGIVGSGFLGLFDTVGDWLKDAIHKHPLVLSFQALKLIKEATAGVSFSTVRITAHFAWKSFTKVVHEPSPGPSTFPDFPNLEVSDFDDAEAQYLKSLGPGKVRPPFDFDTITKDAKALKLKKWPHGPEPLSPEAEKQLDRFRHPRSAFGLERKALIESLGRTPQAMLDQAQKLRDLISVVVGRILPPEMRSYMDDLVSELKKLDDTVLGKKTKAKKQEGPSYPIRHIPDNGELQPIVRRLIVRSKGGDKSELQDFEDRVRKALLAQRYLAPDPA